MNPLYNAGIHLYSMAAGIAAMRNKKVKRMLAGQSETSGRLKKYRSELAPDGFDVWFHVASLGEFEQARPLIEALLSEHPEMSILLSFFSPSGYEVRHNFNPRVAVVYLPFDTPSKVRRFLDEAAPKKAVFVKYEFWGNYLSELSERRIPTYLVSAIFRQKQIFFRPWGETFRKILRKFDHLYVQDDNSARLLKTIGITNTTVAGDTRFDRVAAICKAGKQVSEIDKFIAATPGSLTFVAGSSWPADENLYIPWLLAHPDCRGIIAPHEFDSSRLESLKKRLGSAMLLSELTDRLKNCETFPDLNSIRYIIVDCFGLLSSLYRYADIAYIGGGFGAGIHNINEAATYSVPVIFGPNNHKFKEASDLISCGGGFCIADEKSLGACLDRLTSDSSTLATAGSAAGKYISDNIGASRLILSDLFGIR